MATNRQSTDVVLENWRQGHTKAEWMCADILQIEGFSEIDPQCPLGGPDGGKDIVCVRGGRRWITAVFFPPTIQTFAKIESKLRNDLSRVGASKPNGFAFMTNQRVSPSEREALAGQASQYEFELYHLDRLRAVLDSPKGYGIRLEYLQITMSAEEQLSMWTSMKDDLLHRAIRQEQQIQNIEGKVDRILSHVYQWTGPQEIEPVQHQAGDWPFEPYYPLDLREIIQRHFPGMRLPRSSDIRGDWAGVWGREVIPPGLNVPDESMTTGIDCWGVGSIPPVLACGNFTGTKGREYFAILLDSNGDSGMIVALLRTNGDVLTPYLVARHLNSPQTYFVQTLPPGSYRQGESAAVEGETQEVVTVETDCVNVGIFESCDALHYWSRSEQRVLATPMSD